MTLKNLFLSLLIVCLSAQGPLLNSAAYAENGSGENASAPPDTSPNRTTPSEDDNNNDDSEEQSFEEDREDIGDQDFGLPEIMMITAMAYGTYTVVACPDQYSAIIVAAAATYWVGQEIANWDNYDEGSERDMEAYVNNENEEEQIESLEEAENQTQEAADAIQNKADYARTAGQLFLAASAVAFIEGLIATYPGNQGFDKCAGGEESGGGEGFQGVGNAVPMGAFFFQKYQKEKAYFNSFKHKPNPEKYAYHLKEAQNKADLYSVVQEIRRIKEGANSSLYQKRVYDLAGEESLSNKVKSSLINFGEVMANALFGPKAHAINAKLKAMGLGAAAIAAVWQQAGTAMTALSTTVDTGYARGATYGVVGGLILKGAEHIEEDAETLEENADKYKLLADKLRQAINTGENYEPGVENVRTNIDPDLFNNGGGDGSAPCIKGDRTSVEADPNCDCKKTNSCRDSDLETPQFEGFETPTAIQDSVNSFNETVNSASRGDTEGARTGMEGVNSKSKAIGNLRDQLKDRINEKRKEDGKSPIDFAKKEKKLEKAIPSTFRDAVNNVDGKHRRRLAGLVGPSKNQEEAEKAKEEVKKVVESVKEGDGAKIEDSKDGKDEKDPFEDFSFAEEEEKENPNQVAANMEKVSINQGNEVSDRKNGNIFRMITTRYMKSAYPLLFDKEGESESNQAE